MLEEEIKWRKTYASLSENAFAINQFFLRLTYIDILLCCCTMYVAIIAIKLTALKKVEIFGLIGLDPLGWLGAGIGTAIALSIFNHLRPEGRKDVVFRGWFTPKRFVPLKRNSIAKLINLMVGDGRLKPKKLSRS